MLIYTKAMWSALVPLAKSDYHSSSTDIIWTRSSTVKHEWHRKGQVEAGRSAHHISADVSGKCAADHSLPRTRRPRPCDWHRLPRPRLPLLAMGLLLLVERLGLFMLSSLIRPPSYGGGSPPRRSHPAHGATLPRPGPAQHREPAATPIARSLFSSEQARTSVVALEKSELEAVLVELACHAMACRTPKP